MPRNSIYHKNPILSKVFNNATDQSDHSSIDIYSVMPSVLDNYFKCLPNINVYSQKSEKPRRYQPSRNKLQKWIIENQNLFFAIFSDIKIRIALINLFYKPVNYRNIQFFILGGGYNDTFWGIYNGNELPVKIIQLIDSSTGIEVKQEILAPKEYKYYLPGSSVEILQDNEIITFDHSPGIFSSLLADPIGFDKDFNQITEHKSISLIDLESRTEINHFINYSCHFQQLEAINKVTETVKQVLKSEINSANKLNYSQFETTVAKISVKNNSDQNAIVSNKFNDLTINVTLKFGGYQEFMFFNRFNPYLARSYISLITFTLEQLFHDKFSSRAKTIDKKQYFKARRTLRLGSKMEFAFDIISEIESTLFLEKINSFLVDSRFIFERIIEARTAIPKHLNPYFKTLIKEVRKIKALGRSYLSLKTGICGNLIEKYPIPTPYQHRVLIARQPDQDIMPNSTGQAINQLNLQFLEKTGGKSGIEVAIEGTFLIKLINQKNSIIKNRINLDFVDSAKLMQNNLDRILKNQCLFLACLDLYEINNLTSAK